MKVVQKNFFNAKEENDWEDEWKDMPEFVQDDKEPLHRITVSFDTWEAFEDFGKKLGVTIYPSTNSLRFPRVANRGNSRFEEPAKNFLYVSDKEDES